MNDESHQVLEYTVDRRRFLWDSWFAAGGIVAAAAASPGNKPTPVEQKNDMRDWRIGAPTAYAVCVMKRSCPVMPCANGTWLSSKRTSLGT